MQELLSLFWSVHVDFFQNGPNFCHVDLAVANLLFISVLWLEKCLLCIPSTLFLRRMLLAFRPGM